jgi:hypothetical protein
MKFIILSLVCGFTISCNAQKLRFKVTGSKDSTVFLIKYYGQKLFYADTAEMKNGYVEFDGKKQQSGILGLYLPDQKFFEFIYNNEEVSLETSGPDYTGNLKVKKSEENAIFQPYVKFIGSKKSEANKLGEQRSKIKETDPAYKALGEQIDQINKATIAKITKRTIFLLFLAKKFLFSYLFSVSF